MPKTLTVFAGATTAPAFDRPRPDRLVAGNPLRTTWEHFEREGMSAGTWTCEPGAWHIAFAEGTDEFFHVIGGRIRITDEAGTAREFGPGEACVIPAGFSGLFEVLEPVTKHYVFMRRPCDTA